ncbi:MULTISPECIES: [FeFe] hydrogenase H-cluster maturation GTPase HydF [Dehalobacter]|jgi:[FeFe] hydrogenase H-cluster maturation GTPase HydF|uniref:[FeFe] hydrogenase H-cluster maturation GTPase HydF n=2 Tax=Dehalobacter restrictus TaxID=55583 RepID=A0A857DH63_9FIRM|nr:MULTISPECIES: [FeFe] hydrogenase H-cluster maturation GTPase HydF [Dehalobacter]AHF09296.1 ATP-binding protein [Dehalobacter restrictus DSM 9455]MCG1025254.1 [FeFe] hydrogenase H-cluster maturation GTPase HydF [Dehalobacter sp.]MDJ0305845.1 [FeFe] hydrogenase H-cluster maturation GTPase HydF [Dehalobacter sp.]OCZ52294.1 [FeFe] hydrogenase H-cluster maturation GTPase HydF [Dehalobacter sp. TeCB1]QGZ99831.1 [FeFe] hydrogenase H-cluster maturation GTPase HydF [Dehalobacter restrictus]
MGLNDTPSANRVHIGFFGKRNAGKSSLVNAVTGQDLTIVSDVKGTTTDPVYKAMELLPLGPVVIIDTPGIDDTGALGELRVKKSRQVLNKTDIALLVIDAAYGKSAEDEELVRLLGEKGIHYVVVYNKADFLGQVPAGNDREIYVSAKTGWNIQTLKEKIAALAVTEEPKLKIVGDLIHPGDFVVLVTPIDKAAPKGRLILPQQQTIRDILEADATAIVVKEFEFRETLENLGKKPRLVITDSQVFAKAAADTPKDIFLTSFSILFARYKGSLEMAVKGAKVLDSLKDGDTVLISEGCSHHRQCDDIGTVKLPRWIKNDTQKQIRFAFTSGSEFPDDLSAYRLIIHCGGCMLNKREMKYRQKCAEDQQVPMTNYGILIAYMQGILKRSIAMFPQILAEIEE